MYLMKALRTLFGVGLVFLAVGCAPAVGVPTPISSAVPSTSSLPPPTPTTLPVQNTPAAIAKFIIDQSLSGNGGGVSDLAFSPDGKTLVSQTVDGAIILWDVATGQSIDLPGDQNHPLSSMALSPDGKLLASGGCGEWDTSISYCRQYEIALWDMVMRQPIGQPLRFPYRGPLAHIELAFSPDGKTLAQMFSGMTGVGIIQLFDVTTLQLIDLPLGGEEDFTGMAFSPDGKTMALGTWSGAIYRWNVASRHVDSLPAGAGGAVLSLAFSPDGKTLASLVHNPNDDTRIGAIVLWDAATLQPVGEPLIVQYPGTGGTVALTSMAFSPDGKTLAAIDTDGTITLWDVATHRRITYLFGIPGATGAPTMPTSIAFSPDGKTLASGTEDGAIILWDLATSSHSP